MQPYGDQQQQPLLHGQPNASYPVPPSYAAPPSYGYGAAPAPVYQQTTPVIVATPVSHHGHHTTTTVHHHHHADAANKVGLIGLILCICCGLFPGGLVWLFGGLHLLFSRKVEGSQKSLAVVMVVLGLMSIIGGILIITLVIVPLFAVASTVGSCNVDKPYSVYASSYSSSSIYVSWAAVSWGTCTTDYYEVDYRVSGSYGVWSSTTSYTSSTYINGLNSGTTYEIRVRTVATKASSANLYYSGYSSTVTATTSSFNAVEQPKEVEVVAPVA
jgi:hypothetical protein